MNDYIKLKRIDIIELSICEVPTSNAHCHRCFYCCIETINRCAFFMPSSYIIHTLRVRFQWRHTLIGLTWLVKNSSVQFRCYFNFAAVVAAWGCSALPAAKRFLRATALCYCAHMLSQFRLSVCPSVRLSHGWFMQKRLKLGSCDFHHTVAPSL